MLLNQDIHSVQFEFIAAANEALRSNAHFDLDDLPINYQWSIHKETMAFIQHLTKQSAKKSSYESYVVVMMMVIADGIDDLAQFDDFSESIVQFARVHEKSICSEILALVNEFSFQSKKVANIALINFANNQFTH